MAFLAWWKLWIVERKLYHGSFGKYNRYRCWCLKRNAETTWEKLVIAKEVLNGPGVNTMEAQYNEQYIHQHQNQKPILVSPPQIESKTSQGSS
ncbi:MAG TPA: hypothetical protein VG097_17355 [Gemmata sp.]|jgi:hypothetical protein|nr:hypothetical protein [Gemmata sp.]